MNNTIDPLHVRSYFGVHGRQIKATIFSLAVDREDVVEITTKRVQGSRHGRSNAVVATVWCQRCWESGTELMLWHLVQALVVHIGRSEELIRANRLIVAFVKRHISIRLVLIDWQLVPRPDTCWQNRFVKSVIAIFEECLNIWPV